MFGGKCRERWLDGEIARLPDAAPREVRDRHHAEIWIDGGGRDRAAHPHERVRGRSGGEVGLDLFGERGDFGIARRPTINISTTKPGRFCDSLPSP